MAALGSWAQRRFAIAAVVTVATTLASCSGIPTIPTLSGMPGRGVLLEEQPKRAAEAADNQGPGQHEHLRILAAYGGAYDDPRLQELISQTVERLVASSDRPDLHYKVTILNSPAVNAFALPSGQLYVTRGLAALANDDAELASVLAHEMSHVIARHAAIREDQAKAALVGRVGNDANDPQTSALALAKTKIALASFSRAQEFEADNMGIKIAAKAGYDPYGAVRFLTSMGRNADLKSASTGADLRALDYMSSHPSTPDRVKKAQAGARDAATGASERDKFGYLASVDGLVYGEDPSEGFVRGRRFLHPRLGFTFTAPEGFTLDNTAQAVLGLKEGGGAALRLDVVRIPAEQTLGDYLASGWIENVDRASVEDVSINGFPAATATAKGEDWSFRLYAIRFGTEAYRFIFASKHDYVDADKMFRSTVETFRRMTLDEINAAKPLHLKVIAVEPGDTVERLAAAHMAGLDHALERFRVLNGLEPGARLKPGEQIKTVVE